MTAILTDEQVGIVPQAQPQILSDADVGIAPAQPAAAPAPQPAQTQPPAQQQPFIEQLPFREVLAGQVGRAEQANLEARQGVPATPAAPAPQLDTSMFDDRFDPAAGVADLNQYRKDHSRVLPGDVDPFKYRQSTSEPPARTTAEAFASAGRKFVGGVQRGTVETLGAFYAGGLRNDPRLYGPTWTQTDTERAGAMGSGGRGVPRSPGEAARRGEAYAGHGEASPQRQELRNYFDNEMAAATRAGKVKFTAEQAIEMLPPEPPIVGASKSIGRVVGKIGKGSKKIEFPPGLSINSDMSYEETKKWGHPDWDQWKNAGEPSREEWEDAGKPRNVSKWLIGLAEARKAAYRPSEKGVRENTDFDDWIAAGSPKDVAAWYSSPKAMAGRESRKPPEDYKPTYRMRSKGQAMADQMNEGIAKLVAEHPDWQTPQVNSARDLMSNMDALAGNLGAMLPYIGATLGAVLAGSPETAFVIGVAIEGDQAYQQAKADMLAQIEQLQAAGQMQEAAELQANMEGNASAAGAITGTANAIIEQAQIQGMISAGKATVTAAMKKMYSWIAKAKIAAGMAAKQAFHEGLQETIQGATQDLTAGVVYNKEIDPDEFWNQRQIEGLMGAIAYGGGAVTSGGIHYLTQSKANAEAQRQIEREKAGEHKAWDAVRKNAMLNQAEAEAGPIAEQMAAGGLPSRENAEALGRDARIAQEATPQPAEDVAQPAPAPSALEQEARKAADQAASPLEQAARETTEPVPDLAGAKDAADTKKINKIVDNASEFAEKAGITDKDGLVTPGFQSRNKELLQTAAEAVEAGDVEGARKAFDALKPKMVEWGKVRAQQKAKDARARAKKAEAKGDTDAAVVAELEARDAEAEAKELEQPDKQTKSKTFGVDTEKLPPGATESVVVTNKNTGSRQSIVNLLYRPNAAQQDYLRSLGFQTWNDEATTWLGPVVPGKASAKPQEPATGAAIAEKTPSAPAKATEGPEKAVESAPPVEIASGEARGMGQRTARQEESPEMSRGDRQALTVGDTVTAVMPDGTRMVGTVTHANERSVKVGFVDEAGNPTHVTTRIPVPFMTADGRILSAKPHPGAAVVRGEGGTSTVHDLSSLIFERDSGLSAAVTTSGGLSATLARPETKPQPAEATKPEKTPSEPAKATEGPEKQLPPHMQVLLDKAKKYDETHSSKIADVTPEGYGPAEGPAAERPNRGSTYKDWEKVPKLRNFINESKTILRGKVSGEKRANIERAVAKAEAELAAIKKRMPAETPGATDWGDNIPKIVPPPNDRAYDEPTLAKGDIYPVTVDGKQKHAVRGDGKSHANDLVFDSVQEAVKERDAMEGFAPAKPEKGLEAAVEAEPPTIRESRTVAEPETGTTEKPADHIPDAEEKVEAPAVSEMETTGGKGEVARPSRADFRPGKKGGKLFAKAVTAWKKNHAPAEYKREMAEKKATTAYRKTVGRRRNQLESELLETAANDYDVATQAQEEEWQEALLHNDAMEQYGLDHLSTAFGGKFPGEITALFGSYPGLKRLLTENARGGMAEEAMGMVGGAEEYAKILTETHSKWAERALAELREKAKANEDVETIQKLDTLALIQQLPDPVLGEVPEQGTIPSEKLDVGDSFEWMGDKHEVIKKNADAVLLKDGISQWVPDDIDLMYDKGTLRRSAEKAGEPAKPEPKFAENTVFTQDMEDAADEVIRKAREEARKPRPRRGGFVAIPNAEVLKAYVTKGLIRAEAIIRKAGKLTRKAWNVAMRESHPELDNKDLGRIWGLVKKQSAQLAEIQKPVVAPPAKPVAAEITPQPAEEGEAVGIKNVAVEEQLARRGQLPPKHGPSMTFDQARIEAATAFEVDPFVGKKLVDDLAAAPRPASGYEDAVLLHEMNRLTHEVDRAETAYLEATQSDDAEATKTAQRKLDAAMGDFMLASDVVTMVGTESSHSLGHRRMMLKLDYSLASMERRATIAQAGKPLASDERQLIVKQAKQIAKLEERIAQVEAEDQVLRQQHEIDRKIKATVTRQKKAVALIQEPTFGVGNVVFKRPAAMKAKSALFAMLRSPQMALGPAGMDELVKLGGFYVEGGLRNFKQWKAKILADAGDLATELEPDLAEAWKQITDKLPTIDRPRIIKAMKNAVAKERALPEMTGSINKIAESLIEGGIHDREKLVTALHGILKDIDPSITRTQTVDALSGYGDFRPLNPDPIKAELRDYKGQLQQVRKLQDMQAGKAPAKTGPERRVPSDTERRLAQQVNEAKRRDGFTVTDPATQLKTALQTIKTRLNHQIADIELELATGQRITKKAKPVAKDAEAKALDARLAELREQKEAMFGKKAITDEQRIKLAISAAKRAIEANEKRIADKQPFPKKKTRKTPQTPELAALRARNAALKQEIKLMQDAADLADPSRKDAILNQAYATRTANRIADLQERLAKQDFEPKRKRPPLKLSPASIKLQVQMAKIKEQYDIANFKRQRANRTIPKKILDVLAETLNLPKQLIASGELSGVLRQGGIISISHPAQAAKIALPSLKALASEEGFLAAEEAIKNHEHSAYWARAGLDLTSKTKGLAAMEEGHMSRLASKIPIIRASERHYMTWLNLQRYTACEHLAATLYPDGQLPTADEAKIIAHAVNIMAGRGGQALGPGALAALSTVFWAPRLRFSRFQYLLGHPVWYGAFSGTVPFKGTGRVRWMLAKEYGHFLSKLLLLYGVGLLMGGDVEDDLTSSDAGKVRFGDTRVDPAAGLVQPVVFVSKLVSGKQVTTGGRVASLLDDDKEYGDPGIMDVIGRYLQTGLSPGISRAIALRSGKDFVGEKVTPLNTIPAMTIPLAWRDAVEAVQSEGYAKGAALTALAFLGMGLSTYVSAGPKTRSVRKLAYEAESAYAEKQTPQRQAEQMYYDSIERTLKVYDVAANKLRKTGEQNTPKGKTIRRRQEQLAAIALEGGLIWTKATPVNPGELKLAYTELDHATAQAAMTGKKVDYSEARKALNGLDIVKDPAAFAKAANSTVRTYYSKLMHEATKNGDVDDAVVYYRGRLAIVSDYDEKNKQFQDLRKWMDENKVPPKTRSQIFAAIAKASNNDH